MPVPPELSLSVKLVVKFVVCHVDGALTNVVGAVLSMVQFHIACQPLATVALSDLNLMVNAPPVDVTVPGELAP